MFDTIVVDNYKDIILSCIIMLSYGCPQEELKVWSVAFCGI